MKKKLYIFCVIFLIILLSSVALLSKDYKINIADYLKSNLPDTVYNTLLYIVDFERSQKRLNNNYNVLFLPDTQQLKLNFEKIKLPFLVKSDEGYNKVFKTFRYFIDADDEKIIYATKKGKLYYSDINNFKTYDEIETNLDDNIIIKDVKLNDEFIYLSAVIKNKECLKQNILKGKFNKIKILFEKKFEIDDCKKNIESGRIAFFNIKSTKYLLLATASDILRGVNEESPYPQDDSSPWGKILKIDLNNFNYEVYSKGHRNIHGLVVDEENKKIISTEHGPRGGDEINIIKRNKNYGWALASYGKKYSKDLDSFQYKDHEKFGFEEPVFAFIPSVGISQIIKINESFNDFYWNNNFLIATMQNKSLLRIRFDRNFNKLLFVESIYIGERIVDLKYLKKSKIILLALENTGSLGILRR